MWNDHLDSIKESKKRQLLIKRDFLASLILAFLRTKFESATLISIDKKKQISYSVYPHKNILHTEAEKAFLVQSLVNYAQEIKAVSESVTDASEVFDDHWPFVKEGTFYYCPFYQMTDFEIVELKKLIRDLLVSKENNVLNFYSTFL